MIHSPPHPTWLPNSGVLCWSPPPQGSHHHSAPQRSSTLQSQRTGWLCITPRSSTAHGQPAWRYHLWAISTHAPLSDTASIIQPFLPSLLLLLLPSQTSRTWLSLAGQYVGLFLLVYALCSNSWSAAGRQPQILGRGQFPYLQLTCHMGHWW